MANIAGRGYEVSGDYPVGIETAKIEEELSGSSEIKKALSENNQALLRLQSSVDELVRRVEPVLSPDGPKSDEHSPRVVVGDMSQARRAVCELTLMVDDIRDQVTNILQRLEV